MHRAPGWGTASFSGGAQGRGSPCPRPPSPSPGISALPFPGALARAADLHVAAAPGHLLQGPPGIAPQGVLGLSPLTSHGASVSAPTWVGERGGCPTGPGSPSTLCLLLSRPQQMNQFAVGGQPSPSLQSPPQLYPSTSQPQFPLAPGVQQVLGAGGGGLDSEADTPDLGWLGIALSLSLPTWNMGRTFFTMSWGCSFDFHPKPCAGRRQDGLPGL